MKTLYTIAFVLIAVLTLAAINPEPVADAAHYLKVKYVDQPKQIAELEAMLEKALAGDTNAQVRIGTTLLWNRSHRPDWMVSTLGNLTKEDGERMLRDAASNGHGEAKYWVWRHDDGSEAEFNEALLAGSAFARGDVMRSYRDNPCDTAQDANMEIIRAQFGDRNSPIYAMTTDWSDEMFEEARVSFEEHLQVIQEVRSRECAAE